MNRHDNFELFISEIIAVADKKSMQENDRNIDSMYHSNLPICNIIIDFLHKGWTTYISVVTMIELFDNTSNQAIQRFLSSPIGSEVKSIQKKYDSIDVIEALIQNKRITNIIKKNGESYKSDFESHINEKSYIDKLINTIADNVLEQMLNKN